ncbi:hypothetical protein [Sphingobacterium sp. BN32]|uniref:hypothetical protein n=1 Tax=Sphingobacterium sp. BN32 TaxID=3058432 RepID=UPI00265D06E5|nr:hypothetical protein [Sphingobacterium sp. BN32]WKK58560.1 hypothetical protein QYC40_18220 [Sphingobacterium sp. BN32]
MNYRKIQYVAPMIILTTVEMESGIAAGSASLKPGTSNSPLVPQVEDWTDNGNQSSDFDVL